MATNTTNFTLKKPGYTDTADINDINDNMDKVDSALQGLGSGLAIISKNNTHVAITAGQYVYVHEHGSLTEGLYTAKSNIAANATLSTSNLQADESGGLNALNSKMNTSVMLVDNGDITSSNPIDLDSVQTPCAFYWTAGNKSYVSNKPVDEAGSILNYVFGSRVIQIFANNSGMFHRFGSTNGTWYGDWIDDSGRTTKTITVTATTTDTRISNISCNCVRNGNVVSIYMTYKADYSSSNFLNGNTISFTLSGNPVPAFKYNYSDAYQTGNIFAISIENDGTLRIRNCGGTISSNITGYCTITYIATES